MLIIYTCSNFKMLVFIKNYNNHIKSKTRTVYTKSYRMIRLHLQVNNQRKDIPIVVIKHYCI